MFRLTARLRRSSSMGRSREAPEVGSPLSQRLFAPNTRHSWLQGRRFSQTNTSFERASEKGLARDAAVGGKRAAHGPGQLRASGLVTVRLDALLLGSAPTQR